MRRRFLKRSILVGCGLSTCYLLLVSLSPEAGRDHVRGPAVLNVSGAGYSRGNVVWLGSPERGLSPADGVLYDWRKINPYGMGPAFAIQCYGKLDAEQRKHIVARIRFRLGHDPIRAWVYGKRVY
jgi:hypothetical protein